MDTDKQHNLENLILKSMVVLAFLGSIAMVFLYWQMSISVTAPDIQANLISPEQSWSRGAQNPSIELVVYSDVQCPFCSRYHESLLQLLDEYPDKIKMIFKHFPLAMHSYASLSSEASECAGEQGKFWQYLDSLFANQRKINVDYLNELAQELNLDNEQFKICLDSGKYIDKVKKDEAEGRAVGVRGTPTSFINGEFINGALPYDKLKAKVESKL